MKNLDTLRKRIQRMRLQDPPVTWHEICRRLSIVKEDGKPDPGLAYDILAHEDYYPSSKEVCDRLGIRPLCPNCKRRLTDKARNEPKKKHTPLSVAEKWWRDLPVAVRKERIQFEYIIFLAKTNSKRIY